MIIVVGCVLYLISLTSQFAVEDDFPVLSEQTCQSCPSVYVPVCTDNELTFTNECRVKCYNEVLRKLNQSAVNIAYYGTCVAAFVQVGVQVPPDMVYHE